MEDPNIQDLSLEARDTPDWNVMPMEILAKIANYLDVDDRLTLKRCSRREREVVTQLAKKPDLKIKVEFEIHDDEDLTAEVAISVFDKFDIRQFWFSIYDDSEGTIINKSYDSDDESEEYRPPNKGALVLSTIMKNFLAEETFNVVHLEAVAKKNGRTLDLKSDRLQISLPIRRICTYVNWNQFPDYKDNVLLGASALITHVPIMIKLMVVKNKIPAEIVEHSIFNFVKRNWLHFCVMLDPSHRLINSYAMSQKFVKEWTRVDPETRRGFVEDRGIWRYEHIPMYTELELVFMKEEIIKKLESTDLIKTAMYLFRAYRQNGSNRVVYLNDEPDLEQKTTFLREGLPESFFLNNFQLTVLAYVFKLRLVLDDPDVPKIYEKFCDGFKLVLKKYQEQNIYEKIMERIEKLVEEIQVK